MKIYYIRHAQTSANISGEMVKDYNTVDILPFDRGEWFNKIGGLDYYDAKIYSSPSKRCQQTVKALFGDVPYTILPNLHEFDCGGLGNKKFWEISEEEFNKLVPLDKISMYERIDNALMYILKDCPKTAIIVGHGFYGRTLFDYFNDNGDTPFEILNSKNFTFSNLDMMEIEHCNVKNVYRFREPYKRG